ncbi:alpha/beta fold hydrolase [Rhizosphaericola mali]|uniref:Alpha/beta hydrolase n=1 Tax=Rhizosphaericola mali TaxID=2545455 RepID=A0A5P2G0J8_9BACT|nr:alpha/beta hydrolase [Rhizosphaericola mali]QES87649.1 alpha/beta hydrolase [Rhizosphaericola mali]
MSNNIYDSEKLLQRVPDFESKFICVNNIQLHYLEGGKGAPLILIPGYPETWWAYHKIMTILAKKYKVIVLEIRGMGESEKPQNGYEKKQMAQDVLSLVNQLELGSIIIAGHDIGAHVAFSFAAQFPESTSKLIILDTPHPDPSMYQLPMLPIPNAPYLYPWWLSFNQVKILPEQLLNGKMNILINWLFDHLLANKTSVSEFDKAVYANAYDSTEAIRSANAWYQAFAQDIDDFKTYPKIKLPVLGIGGSGFYMLQMALPAVASNLELKQVENVGHFLMEENHEIVSHFIENFIGEE